MSTEGLKIHVPAPLRQYVDGQAAIAVSGQTVGEALTRLTRLHPDLRRHLYQGGKQRASVNVYVNDEDVRYLGKENTPLQTGDVISIAPSIAGGAGVCRAMCCCAGAHTRRRRYR